MREAGEKVSDRLEVGRYLPDTVGRHISETSARALPGYAARHDGLFLDVDGMLHAAGNDLEGGHGSRLPQLKTLRRRPVWTDVQIVISANQSDLSGWLLFEEAHCAGVRAAALALGRAQLP